MGRGLRKAISRLLSLILAFSWCSQAASAEGTLFDFNQASIEEITPWIFHAPGEFNGEHLKAFYRWLTGVVDADDPTAAQLQHLEALLFSPGFQVYMREHRKRSQALYEFMADTERPGDYSGLVRRGHDMVTSLALWDSVFERNPDKLTGKGIWDAFGQAPSRMKVHQEIREATLAKEKEDRQRKKEIANRIEQGELPALPEYLDEEMRYYEDYPRVATGVLLKYARTIVELPPEVWAPTSLGELSAPVPGNGKARAENWALTRPAVLADNERFAFLRKIRSYALSLTTVYRTAPGLEPETRGGDLHTLRLIEQACAEALPKTSAKPAFREVTAAETEPAVRLAETIRRLVEEKNYNELFRTYLWDGNTVTVMREHNVPHFLEMMQTQPTSVTRVLDAACGLVPARWAGFPQPGREREFVCIPQEGIPDATALHVVWHPARNDWVACFVNIKPEYLLYKPMDFTAPAAK